MSGPSWNTPAIEPTLVEDRTAEARCDRGFLRLRRLVLRNRYPDGSESAPYPYDVVERDALDAVVVVLYAEGQGGPQVCIRSALRPPLWLRPGYVLPLPADGQSVLWELPAGLIEQGEEGLAGMRRCAARETLEETGFELAPELFEPLGPAVYLTPGVLAEQVHFFSAPVDPDHRGRPTEDGSPVEEQAEVRFVSLDVALAACADGSIRDSKTELGLRRLKDALGARP